LFGAGSGNVLTKITKYAATVFFVMALLLSILQRGHYGRNSSFQQKLNQPLSAMPGAPAPAAVDKSSTPAPNVVAPLTSSTNTDLTSTPQVETTNAPASPPAAENNPAPPK
jgi:hypothetical protein